MCCLVVQGSRCHFSWGSRATDFVDLSYYSTNSGVLESCPRTECLEEQMSLPPRDRQTMLSLLLAPTIVDSIIPPVPRGNAPKPRRAYAGPLGSHLFPNICHYTLSCGVPASSHQPGPHSWFLFSCGRYGARVSLCAPALCHTLAISPALPLPGSLVPEHGVPELERSPLMQVALSEAAPGGTLPFQGPGCRASVYFELLLLH